MKNFAKIFDTELGQIVLILDANGDQIKYMFNYPDVGIATVTMEYDDGIAAGMPLQEAFDKIDKKTATVLVRNVMENCEL